VAFAPVDLPARRLVELVDKLHKRAQRRGRAGCGQVDVALKQG
jgi:hypothetical protein